jgi:hypothetical protein
MRCRYVYDDGGRAAAGFRGNTGDCVTRAIAIATARPYAEIYEELDEIICELEGRLSSGRSRARTGVFRKTYGEYLRRLGWRWVPCVFIGSGCKVHLRRNELPSGRIIVRLSRHISCVVDGVIHDTFNPSRAGTRCVYGYYTKEGSDAAQ